MHNKTIITFTLTILDITETLSSNCLLPLDIYIAQYAYMINQNYISMASDSILLRDCARVLTSLHEYWKEQLSFGSNSISSNIFTIDPLVFLISVVLFCQATIKILFRSWFPRWLLFKIWVLFSDNMYTNIKTCSFSLYIHSKDSKGIIGRVKRGE